MSNVELVNKFKVTKALIEAYVNNGLTVKMMAEDITNQSGVKCSDAVIRAAPKTYGINLRLKKMPSHFVFEDLDITASPAPVTSGFVSVEAQPNEVVTYVQAEEPIVEA